MRAIKSCKVVDFADARMRLAIIRGWINRNAPPPTPRSSRGPERRLPAPPGEAQNSLSSHLPPLLGTKLMADRSETDANAFAPPTFLSSNFDPEYRQPSTPAKHWMKIFRDCVFGATVKERGLSGRHADTRARTHSSGLAGRTSVRPPSPPHLEHFPRPRRRAERRGSRRSRSWLIVRLLTDPLPSLRDACASKAERLYPCGAPRPERRA